MSEHDRTERGHLDVHIHLEGLSLLFNHLTGMEKRIMASVQDVLDTVVAERAEVQGKLKDLSDQVKQLQDAGAASATDLDRVQLAIKDISEPLSTPVPVPEPASTGTFSSKK